MKLVEIVKGPHTSDETAETARQFAIDTGKTPIVLHKEVPGFVVNRINAAVVHEALSLLEQGVASVEDIDTACEKGLNYPMGPFRLMDLTGIDVNYYVRVDRYAESHDPYDAPNPLVIEKFKKGEFGRKTGKGWYDYSDSKNNTIPAGKTGWKKGVQYYVIQHDSDYHYLYHDDTVFQQ